MASSPLHLAAFDLEKLRAGTLARPVSRLPTEIASLDEALSGGLPRGSVVELCASRGLGRATRIALAACAAAQREQAERDCWCAWVDTSGTLYAPGVARAGVDLKRLLVVRPGPADITKVAVRLAASQVFSVLVIDRCGIPGAAIHDNILHKQLRWSTAVRRLALAAEGSDTTILLLSSEQQARESLPVAMRIALERPSVDQLHLRIAKDRRGGATRAGALCIPTLDLDMPKGARLDEAHRRHRVA